MANTTTCHPESKCSPEADAVKEPSWTKPRFILLIIAAIVLLWLAHIDWLVWLFGSETLSAENAIGDSFGALNSLFSGLAFGLFIYTALLRRYELKLQRMELQETREAIKEQAKQLTLQTQEFKEQNEIQRQRNRDDLFYLQLNNLYKDIAKKNNEFANLRNSIRQDIIFNINSKTPEDDIYLRTSTFQILDILHFILKAIYLYFAPL